MARIKGIRIIPAHESEVIEKLTCSLCGAEAPQPNADDHRIWVKRNSFDLDGVSIVRTTGASYPEGGSTEQVGYDVCPECWDSKVVPFFQSQGAEPYREESDW